MAIYVLDGSMKEIKVLGRYVSVKNNSGSVMYASSEPDLSPEAKKVLPVTAGESITVPNCNKKVYVKGTGQVAIESSNFPYNFFNFSRSEGGGNSEESGITQQQLDEALSKKVDAVEGMGLSENSFTTPEKNKLAGLENYDDSDLKADIAALESSKANKSEIPASLPANGGNADTVGGYGAESLIQSNPNLLDNPDFKINQRGSNHYEKNSNTFYTVDRWRCQKGFSVDVLSSGGVEVTRIIDNTSSGPLSAFLQTVPYNKIGNDIKACVASIYVEEVSQNTGIYARLAAYDNDLNVIFQSGALNLQPGLNVMTLGKVNPIPSACSFMRLAVNFDTTVPVGGKVRLKYAKMEYGVHATPFVPPDPTVELLKCQKYFQVFDGIIANDAEITNNYITYRIPTPVPMRVNPSIEGSSTFKVYISGESVNYDDFDYAITSHDQFPYLHIKATKNNHGIVHTKRTMLVANYYVYLSADL